MKVKLSAGAVIFSLAAIALAVSILFSLSRGPSKVSVEKTTEQETVTGASIEELERQSSSNPEDSGAWRNLGRAYFDAGRFDDAVNAYIRAAQATPNLAAIWSALGEARVMASKTDPMPEEALADFKQAIAIDPTDHRARYFLAVNRDLGGDHRGAISDWLALLADTPPGAPWEQDLRRTIYQVGRINNVAVAERISSVKQPAGAAPSQDNLVAGQAIPGPTAQDLRAAASIPPSQQREMAQGMVARLEARLRSNPADVDGWAMLMRSRITLGEPGKASAALAEATRTNPGQAARLREEAAVLGVH